MPPNLRPQSIMKSQFIYNLNKDAMTLEEM